MISKIKLNRWRREALILSENYREDATAKAGVIKILCTYILELTQELLDQHLTKGK